MTQARVELLADSRQVRRATDDLRQLEARGKSTTDVTNQLRNAFVALGGTLAVREVGRLADTYTNIQNRLRIVTDSTAQLTQVQQQLLQVANDSRAEFETTVGLYSTLARSTEELEIGQERLLRITETINKAFAASGADAATAAGAIRQLGQGLASGALRGDEFNSVAEGAPEIMRAIAAETGLTIGELREFAAQGQITSELLIRSLENYGDTVDEIFSTAERTISQSFQEARNNAIQFIGGVEAVEGAATTFGDAIVGLSENLDLLVDGATVLAAVVGVRVVQSLQASVTASIAAAAAQRAEAQAAFFAAQGYNVKVLAVQRATASQVAFAASAGAARGALALLGGPVGAAVLAATAVNIFTDRAREAREELERNSLNNEIETLVENYEELNRQGQRQVFQNLVQESIDLNASLQDVNERIREAEEASRSNGFGLGGNFAQIQNLQRERLELEQKLTENNEKRQAIFDRGMPVLEQAAQETENRAQSDEKDVLALQKQSAAAEERLRIERQIARLREGALSIGFELGIGDDPAAQAEDLMFARLSEVDNALAAQAISIEEARALELQIEREYQDSLTNIQREAAQERLNQLDAEMMARRAAFESQVTALGDVFGNFAEIARQGGEDSFESYKLLASAQAAMSAAVAINRALAEGGPFLGPALAISIGALTAQQIARINQQQYQPRALGGQVTAGGQYLVGERGPELITMGSNGNVTPYNQLMREARGGQGIAQNVRVIVENYGSDKATTSETTVNDERIIRVVVGDISRRGRVHKAMTQTTNATNKVR